MCAVCLACCRPLYLIASTFNTIRRGRTVAFVRAVMPHPRGGGCAPDEDGGLLVVAMPELRFALPVLYLIAPTFNAVPRDRPIAFR